MAREKQGRENRTLKNATGPSKTSDGGGLSSSMSGPESSRTEEEVRYHNRLERSGPLDYGRGWRRIHVQILIVLRCTAESRFHDAMQAPRKDSVGLLWEEIAEQISRMSDGDARADESEDHSGKACQWMWNRLLRDYTDVLGGDVSQDDFPYFADMGAAWENFRSPIGKKQ